MSRGKWAILLAACIVLAAVAAAAYAAGAGKATGAAPAQEVVRAKCFQLVNDEGEERAKLDLMLDGSPSLSMCDETGRLRLILSCRKDGLSLQMFDRDVTRRLALGLSEDGSPRLELLDKDGKARATLGVVPDGSSTLAFRDEKSRPRVHLTGFQGGGGGLLFNDDQGVARASILVAEDGRSAITLRRPDGKVLWHAP